MMRCDDGSRHGDVKGQRAPLPTGHYTSIRATPYLLAPAPFGPAVRVLHQQPQRLPQQVLLRLCVGGRRREGSALLLLLLLVGRAGRGLVGQPLEQLSGRDCMQAARETACTCLPVASHVQVHSTQRSHVMYNLPCPLQLWAPGVLGTP